ncbi:NAD(P)-dependent dehydrogenase (short-subunit alcohol dehydrogenase family) [Arthrobacter sp. CAN_A214]|uniref:hypothetical protein n=1 Tax=Arthrobacter sp. CAN_A214 TaxID=2787720 RepID=UPI0018CA7B7A
MTKELSTSTALITGVTSGIGRATAQALAGLVSISSIAWCTVIDERSGEPGFVAEIDCGCRASLAGLMGCGRAE